MRDLKKSYLSGSERKIYLNSKGLFTADALAVIEQKTPASEIEIATDAQGNEVKSVKARYVKHILTIVSSGNYVFNVLKNELVGDEVVVHARLAMQNTVIEQFGTFRVSKDARGRWLDYGNAVKSATTDALKKCASEYGICWDIYRRDNVKKEVKKQHDYKTLKKIENFNEFLKRASSNEEVNRCVGQYLESKDAKYSDIKEQVELRINAINNY